MIHLLWFCFSKYLTCVPYIWFLECRLLNHYLNFTYRTPLWIIFFFFIKSPKLVISSFRAWLEPWKIWLRNWCGGTSFERERSRFSRDRVLLRDFTITSVLLNACDMYRFFPHLLRRFKDFPSNLSWFLLNIMKCKLRNHLADLTVSFSVEVQSSFKKIIKKSSDLDI